MSRLAFKTASLYGYLDFCIKIKLANLELPKELR